MQDAPARTRSLIGRGNLRRRQRVNRRSRSSSTVAAVLAVAVLLIVLGSVLPEGRGALNLDFITKSSALFGESGGGIANAIVGTAIMVGLASLMAIPVGCWLRSIPPNSPTSAWPTSFASPSTFSTGSQRSSPASSSTASWSREAQQSGYAAAVALAIIMLPIVARTAQEVLELVPGTLKEGAFALGVTRWRTVIRVTLPTAAGGLLTGSLLAVARVAGETAPLIFCSSIFVQGQILTDPSQALPSIPLYIFTQSEAPSPAAHTQAWAAALILIAIVLVLNIVARAFYGRARKRMGA